MKREFLKQLNLDDAAVDAIMAEYGKSHRQTEQLQQRCTELEQELAQVHYTACIEQATKGLQFSSKSAKDAFVHALQQKKLPLKDESLQGYSEFLAAYRQNDPKAFADETSTAMFVRGGAGKPTDFEGGLRAAFGL